MKNNEKQGSLGVLSKPHRSSEHRSEATQEPLSIPISVAVGIKVKEDMRKGDYRAYTINFTQIFSSLDYPQVLHFLQINNLLKISKNDTGRVYP
jgi:hypothetical protein